MIDQEALFGIIREVGQNKRAFHELNDEGKEWLVQQEAERVRSVGEANNWRWNSVRPENALAELVGEGDQRFDPIAQGLKERGIRPGINAFLANSTFCDTIGMLQFGVTTWSDYQKQRRISKGRGGANRNGIGYSRPPA